MLTSKTSLTERFVSQPALLDTEGASRLNALLSSLPLTSEEYPVEDMMALTFGFSPSGQRKPFAFADGLAFIGVYGMLLHRFNWCCEWATGYDNIRMKLEAALADPEVKGIVFDINSPGGQVAGNFELADMIYGSRSRKKTLALVDGSATSGAYSIASGAHRIVASPSSRVGSIGVVMMHASYAEYMKDNGIEITFMYAGKHKIDGNSYQKLPEDVRDRYQASVDKSYTAFVNLVARNRGIEADAVRNTEALIYDAEDAKRIGLIDAIDQPDRAIAAFRKELSGSSLTTGGSTMSNENQPDAAAAAAAVPALAPAAAASPAPSNDEEVIKAAIAADRARAASIRNHDEAKGREALANHLADSGMAVDEAIAILKVAPKVEAAAPNVVDPLSRMMEGQGGGAGISGNGAGGDSADLSPADRIIKNAALAGLPAAPSKSH